MVCQNRKKKDPRERCYLISALKSKHIAVSLIFLVIILLTIIVTPCFAAENGIS